MAMMAKMRSLAPAFIITVGAIFVLFMVISDSNFSQFFGGRPNKLGSVNGDDITYQEFMTLYDQQRETQKKQTGKDIEDENVDQFRDQIWDAIVTQKLLEQQIKKFGISVSDQEVQDAILGDNPPEFLKQNFVDSTGNFNRSLYEQALFDPRNKQALVQAEEYVKQQRLNEKLQSMLLATINISEADIKRKFIDQNISINSQYALVDINQMPDSMFSVNDDDMKDYYNKNVNKFKVEPSRKLKYVLFKLAASAEDSVVVMRELNDVSKNFGKDTSTFKTIVQMYSSYQYMKDTVAPNTLSSEVLDRMTRASKGDLVGPVATPQGVGLYHVIDIVPSKDSYVRASHILINQFGSDEKNLEEANKVYDQLIKGASFEQLAKEKSGSPEGQTKGGDLGWFGKGMMVPEFEKAAMEGKIGVIQKPVKSNFGYHIIKTTGKISNRYALEWVLAPVKPSASTMDAKQNAAADFAYLANKNGFEEEAKQENLNIQETPAFFEKSFGIPGLGANKRLVAFAFESSLNTLSDKPFKVATGYVVVKVSEVVKEGVNPLDKVKAQIKPLAIREKKYEKAKQIIEDIKKKVNGNLEQAPIVSKYAVTNTTGSFTPGGTVPSVGRDYAFIEKALETGVNKLSEPFRGQRGYFIIKIIEKTNFDSSAYSIQRNTLRDNLLQEKKSSFFNQWLEKLKKDADIADNRHLYFGQ